MRPDNRTGGATEGAALSAIADSIPGTFGLIGKGINAIRPQKFADDLVQNLGAGKSLENNAQSLAQDIQNAYTKRMQEGSQLYQPVFNQAGNSNLYQALENGAGKYQGLTDDILKNYDFDLKDLHNTFTNNPTFQNAHELKSQLGSAVRQLSKNPAPDQATRNTIQAYQRAKGAIDADMQGFLNNAHPDLGAQYQAANNYWATHVAPYRDSSQLLKIASGDVTNPRNISSLFKNPEPEIQKVLSDLPEGSNYKILYNELGKSGAISKPENLLKAYEKLDDKGLSSYVTPDLANKMDTLTSRVKNRDFAQRGVGFLGGALGARLIPGSEALPWVAEGIGGAIGATGAPKAMQAIQRALPQSTGNLTRGIGNAYNLTAKAALANLLAGDQ